MDASTNEEPPPLSTDLAGWRQAVADGRFRRFPLEAVAAAIQDLRPNRDGGLINALAKHLSDSVYRIAWSQVGRNHPNRGKDIVERVHGQFWEALAQPLSADGKAFRQALIPRLLFRVKDAITKEARERRTPDETAEAPAQNAKKSAALDGEEGTEIELVDISACPDLDGTTDPQDEDNWSPTKTEWSQSLLAGVRAADEQIDVGRFLRDNIANDRKRLAFYLYMDGLTVKSKDHHSIAKAIGIDERTVRQWIKEIKAQLKEKIGDLK